MKSPILAMHKNILWSRNAGVWGIWRVAPKSYGFTTLKKKRAIREDHQKFFRAVKGEGMLLGLQHVLDPAGIVKSMISGIPLDSRPAWAEEALANLDRMELSFCAQRSFWICMPLQGTAVSGFAASLEGVFQSLSSLLLPSKWVPSQAEIAERLSQVEVLQTQVVGRYFDVTPATVAEQLWIFNRSFSRGLGEESIPELSDENQISTGVLSPVYVDVAGQSDGGKMTLKEKLANNFVSFTGLDGQTSYQSQTTIQEFPPGGFIFPGSEWIGRIDELGVDLDWCLRFRIKPRDQVRLKLKKARRNLADQQREVSGTTDRSIDQGIERAIEDLNDYSDIFDSQSMEVESEFTLILSVSGARAEECLEQTRRLHDALRAQDIKPASDFSIQFKLWEAMLPGVPTSKTVWDYSQITTAQNLAAFAPLISSEVGQEEGILLGFEIGSGQNSPVLLDVSGASVKMNTSPAIGICGDLGGGKSYAAKHIALSTIKREDAQLITIDRTPMGEWIHAVSQEKSRAAVVINEHAQFSIDPLRLFPTTADGASLCTSFLMMLLNISATDQHGAALGALLDQSFAVPNKITSLGSLVRWLESNAKTLPGGEELLAKIKVFSTKTFTRAVFDDSLPCFDQDASAVVFHASDFALPTEEELREPHLFKQLPLQKQFGRALYALLAGYTKVKAFRDQTRLTLFAVDEAHAITSSPEGMGYLKEFIRDGRKHKCALLIASHNPDPEFGDRELRGLIRCRLIFRHSDRALASSALDWFYGVDRTVKGSDVVPGDLVDLVSEEISPPDGNSVPLHRRGECLFRDYSGNVGLVKVMGPAVTRIEKVISTTPKSFNEVKV